MNLAGYWRGGLFERGAYLKIHALKGGLFEKGGLNQIITVITKTFVYVVTMQRNNTTYARICHMSQKNDGNDGKEKIMSKVSLIDQTAWFTRL